MKGKPSSKGVTVGLFAAPPPKDIPLSPVSISALPALGRLRDACDDLGYRFVTVDSPKVSSGVTVALWDFGSLALPPPVVGSIPTVAWSLESPLVAHRAYHRIDRIASESDFLLGFAGVRGLLEDDGNFRPLFWPNKVPEGRDSPPWSERRLAVLINSNKNVDSLRGKVSMRDPYRSVRRLAAAMLASTYRMRGSWTVPNLYRERLRMIEAFASEPGFDLYGVGWDRPVVGASTGFGAALARCYRGVADDKHETLSGYRFALCLENTRFPGYISEKLFDCFFTGTIPVYLGAPDIGEYVPEEAFVRADAFEDPSALLAHLQGMDAERSKGTLAAGRDFLTSPPFKLFTEEHFVSTVMAAIDRVMNGRG